MYDYFIVPICLGHLIRDKSAMTYLSGAGRKLSFPIIAWLISGAGKNILVDTGTNGPEETVDFHKPLLRTENQTLEFALAQLSLAPADIDIVVNTHLHWDHCYNNHLFPNAKFFVQKEELKYAIAPLPAHVHGYEALQLGMRPPFTRTKWEDLDGDEEIAPGITVLLTPGHTPGSQSVLVKSSRGSAFIGGDTIPLFESWNQGSTGHGPIPSGIYTDLDAYYKTFRRLAPILNKTDLILPGHDQLIFELSHPLLSQLPKQYAIPAGGF